MDETQTVLIARVGNKERMAVTLLRGANRESPGGLCRRLAPEGWQHVETRVDTITGPEDPETKMRRKDPGPFHFVILERDAK